MTKSKSEDFKIQGFKKPESNYFKMPVEWINYTAQISSLAELKVIQYVLRHTWGYQEFGIAKRISTDEFMNGRVKRDGTRIDMGTGLSKPSVIEGLRLAVQHGFIVEQVDDEDKGRIKKYYALKMLSELNESNLELEDEESESDVKNLYPDVKNLYPRGEKSLHRTEKDTLERNLEIHISNFEGSAPSSYPQVPGANGTVSTEVESNPNQGEEEAPYSETIGRIVKDFTNQHLHDTEHVYSNVTQAMNLWRASELSEDEFIDLITEAKQVTLKNSGNIRKKAGSYGIKNRAPYFFSVVKDLLAKRTLAQLEEQRQQVLKKFASSTNPQQNYAKITP